MTPTPSPAKQEAIPVEKPSFYATACRNCAGSEWVCENHQDKPWGGLSADPAACECGAGAPCPVCCRGLSCASMIQEITSLREELICTLEELRDHNGDDMLDSRSNRIDELRTQASAPGATQP